VRFATYRIGEPWLRQVAGIAGICGGLLLFVIALDGQLEGLDEARSNAATLLGYPDAKGPGNDCPRALKERASWRVWSGVDDDLNTKVARPRELGRHVLPLAESAGVSDVHEP
jgi:hypothetical protein